uniref:Uncharacterized protein n=1 Tax=Candidatus Kentrum sp. FM TaxID=2126340 RepID=A0A450RZ35_9GAMM|nr:MAG: hypothetical protein BECKFM1743A_GA0114220_1001413 [Candidatus Kentron sp. FM]VFJ44532.1 MAG: hypothetical protein BECKFM1743C_GA0114222_1001215 [Candidatus Kentron sp. FM]VFK05995.1 MAG: hypothetical protein BECKFM1743B_GA0114221_1000819 [Candidatus Kentron sp. FM]
MPASLGKVKQDTGSPHREGNAISYDHSVIFHIDYLPSSSWAWNKIKENSPPNELTVRDDASAFRPTLGPLASEDRSDIQAADLEHIKKLFTRLKAEAKRQRAIDAMKKLRGSGNGGLFEALLELRGRGKTDSREPVPTPRVFSGVERQRAIEAMKKLRGSDNGGLFEALLELRGREAT